MRGKIVTMCVHVTRGDLCVYVLHAGHHPPAKAHGKMSNTLLIINSLTPQP